MMTAPDDNPPFRKVLIANRGEIACRVIRTLREIGIASVAIHHPVEARARHVREADQAVEISGETPVAAHLDIAQIIDAARAVGADAIHPGYGFLSENARFARAVAEAGLTFIGPDADTIALMGDKISARQFAADHGVPVAPSVMPTQDLAEFTRQATQIGFPLLIKAAAGGGGKGMSIVRSAEELEGAARHAASEAQRYFGDGRVYAELFVERPRHIEVQVFGDGKGSAIHLFERECSVQRRFQKIIEEAPAANLPAALRDEICASAVRLAAAANYCNAGTVEYILGADGRFFFLEMNTRLQVEHPVTEMITGLDLPSPRTPSSPMAMPSNARSVPRIPSAIFCPRPARSCISTRRRPLTCASRTRSIAASASPPISTRCWPSSSPMGLTGPARRGAPSRRCTISPCSGSRPISTISPAYSATPPSPLASCTPASSSSTRRRSPPPSRMRQRATSC